MSHVSTLGVAKTIIPYFRSSGSAGVSTSTLAASGKSVQFIGDVYLENPLGGSKTISAAGGGSIIWRAGTTTFANGSSVFTVGIQDVSTSTSPVQGDGTFDVKAVHTGSGITSAAINTSVMTTGTKTIAHGDQIAIVLEFTTFAGADSVIVSYGGTGFEVNINNVGNTVLDNLTGGVFVALAGVPLAIIKFDDGSVGQITLSNFSSTNASTAINSSTATADEYGNLIKVPSTFYAMGIYGILNFVAGNAGDLELLLYSDPLGSTPVAEKTITIDATQVGIAGTARPVVKLFPVPFLMKANTPYAVTVRPTTTNNVTMYYDDGTTDSKPLQPPNDYAYAVRRLDNTGAFADTNSGTAKTRLYRIGVIGFFMDQGVNSTTYQIGM